jgi:hypothetical protein
MRKLGTCTTDWEKTDMSDVAKHASTVGHGVMPFPDPPVLPNLTDAMKIPFQLGAPTVFDGDDYTPVNSSFDIDGAAARVVTEYDRNGDGAIDLRSGGLLGDVLSETSRTRDHDVASIRQLATYADAAGNKDGSATVEEIADVIRRFDQGNEGDGRLSAQERETFLEVFGEQLSPLHKSKVQPFPFPIAPREPKFRHMQPEEGVLIGNHPPFDAKSAAAKVQDD